MLCHNGDFWNRSAIEEVGYDNITNFFVGKNKIQNGWKAGEDSVKHLFDKVYKKPNVKEFLREDSYLKVNGTLHIPLEWKERPMRYQGGQCFELKLSFTNFSMNTLILKFKDIEDIAYQEKINLYILLTGIFLGISNDFIQ